ncbi:MAG TPA: hypothetical protein VGJ91_04495 [Polyangiaceae bacterium]|jgi:hypothetical protein
MSSGLALPISIAISLAALVLVGCGSSAAGPSSGTAGEPGAAGESAGKAGMSGKGGSGGGVPIAGASGSGGGAIAGASGSGGGAIAGTSGSGGQPTADQSDPACPATVPAMGATCSTAGVCNYLDCAGAGQSTATCDGVTFSVTTGPCQAVPCGTTGSPPHALSCTPDEICVEHQGGNVWYECRPDPCAPAAQGCGCASSLCGAKSSCAFQSFKLVCGCTGSCA